MKTISFIAPEKFDETHLDKLFKGLVRRFRFAGIKVYQSSKNLNEINICFNDTVMHSCRMNNISDYVNGFFAAIE